MFEWIFSSIADQTVSALFGFVGGWAYHGVYFWNLRQSAPSARRVVMVLGLTEGDYHALPEKKENVVYLCSKEDPPSDLKWWERVRSFLFPGY